MVKLEPRTNEQPQARVASIRLGSVHFHVGINAWPVESKLLCTIKKQAGAWKGAATDLACRGSKLSRSSQNTKMRRICREALSTYKFWSLRPQADTKYTGSGTQPLCDSFDALGRSMQSPQKLWRCENLRSTQNELGPQLLHWFLLRFRSYAMIHLARSGKVFRLPTLHCYAKTHDIVECSCVW